MEDTERLTICCGAPFMELMPDRCSRCKESAVEDAG